MYSVTVDPYKNMLILRLEDFLSDEEIKTGVEEAIAKANMLEKGFILISDVTRMKPVSQFGASEIKRAQQHMANRMGRFIRVVANPISSLQLNRMSQSVGFIAETAGSMEEALQMVAQSDSSVFEPK